MVDPAVCDVQAIGEAVAGFVIVTAWVSIGLGAALGLIVGVMWARSDGC